MAKKLNKKMYFEVTRKNNEKIILEVEIKEIKDILKKIKNENKNKKRKRDKYNFCFVCEDGQKIDGKISISELEEVLKTYE